jgi:hypothetical protein
MKIKINKDNADKIESALAAVNGKAVQFTIRSASEVIAAAELIDARLAMLPKKDRVGASGGYIGAGPSAKAYKYRAVTTSLLIKRFASGWFMISAARSDVYPGDNTPSIFITITPTQCEQIKARSVVGFHVQTPDAKEANQ